MTETIEYEQFEQAGNGSAAHASGSEVDLSRLSDIPMELSVEIGRTHMTVGETLDLRVGSVVALERLSGETADLLVNGTAIARGEVVVIDEQYGLRITEILDGQHDGELAESVAGPAPIQPATAGNGDAADAVDPVGREQTSAPAKDGPAPAVEMQAADAVDPAVADATGPAPPDEARAPDER